MRPGLGLYIHIPFCRAKCRYCSFNSYPGLEALIPSYVQAVAKDIGRWGRALSTPRADTIYFGGGTPSLLTTRDWRVLLEALNRSFELADGAEVTSEANPGTVTAGSLAELRGLGVNRLSLGVQSFDDAELAQLGRIHSAAEAVDVFSLARCAGFDNVNVDLIYGLPRQPLSSWRASLERAISLASEHVSLYALTLEEETPLGRAVACGEVPAPDPDLVADMYLLAEELLEAAGYQHYEISNWARLGRECRHNLGYWRNRPYLGFGAGAHSYWGGYRFWAVASPAEYVAWMETAGQLADESPPVLIRQLAPVQGMEAIDKRLELAETMILGLRLVEGVSLDEVPRRFGRDAITVYQDAINDMVGLGLLETDGDRLRLSARGRLLGNEVFVKFLPQTRV